MRAFNPFGKKLQGKYILLFFFLPSTLFGNVIFQETYYFHELIRFCQLLWTRDRDFEKAHALLEKLAQPIPKIDAELQQERLHQLLGFLYEVGVQNDDQELLCQIYPWMEELQMHLPELEKLWAINNHYADSETLFKRHHYKEAASHLLWVLTLEPDLLKGHKLLGMVLFAQKKYKEASSHLSFVDDAECRRLEALCRKHLTNP